MDRYKLDISSIAGVFGLSVDFIYHESKDIYQLVFSDGTEYLFSSAKLSGLNRRGIKREVYNHLFRTHGPIQWGILTGVRPIKIVTALLLDGKLSDEEILSHVKEEYLVSADKAQLMLDIAKIELDFIREDSSLACLYVSIPFCPSRCSYCSFPAEVFSKKQKLLPRYLELLKQEIEFSLKLAKDKGLFIDCIYIGGGTPSVLSAQQIGDLLDFINQRVKLDSIREYTFEAGRIDTITKEKLLTLREKKVNRISINPQTFTEAAQKNMGRIQTVSDFKNCFELARSVGGFIINSDLIAGLPGDDKNGFLSTVRELISLSPENITLHALSLKRGSKLNEHKKVVHIPIYDFSAETSFELAKTELTYSGYFPYYLYRQKNIKDNLYNVGFARKGYESLYNIRIIEETHTIIACGVGAVSKLIVREENRHERVPNFNSLEEYINNFDRLISKKETLWASCWEKSEELTMQEN